MREMKENVRMERERRTECRNTNTDSETKVERGK